MIETIRRASAFKLIEIAMISAATPSAIRPTRLR